MVHRPWHPADGSGVVPAKLSCYKIFIGWRKRLRKFYCAKPVNQLEINYKL